MDPADIRFFLYVGDKVGSCRFSGKVGGDALPSSESQGGHGGLVEKAKL